MPRLGKTNNGAAAAPAVAALIESKSNHSGPALNLPGSKSAAEIPKIIRSRKLQFYIFVTQDHNSH